MAVIALDLGGTKLAGALVTGSGRFLRRTTVPLAGHVGAAVGELIGNLVLEMLAAAAAQHVRVSAIGVSVPGISYARTGTVWAPNVPGWKAFPLRRELRKVLRHSSVPSSVNAATPVLIDNDRAACLLGETWRGAAKDCKNVVFLAVGTGIGAGILVDGHILRGADGSAGSIGWWALDRPFRPEYAACGCFEFHASGAGLPKAARALQRRTRPARTELNHFPTSTDIFAAGRRGHPLAQKALAQAVEHWGMAVANLVSVFNPEKIIFGGGLFGPAARFLGNIRREAGKWAQPVAIRQVKLRVSKLGADAPLYGAAALALRPDLAL